MAREPAGNPLTKVNLPGLVFMFSVGQICSMMNISEPTFMATYLYYPTRNSGVKKKHHMTAVNIAPEDQKAEWRISIEEFRQWLRRMGFKATDITYW